MDPTDAVDEGFDLGAGTWHGVLGRAGWRVREVRGGASLKVLTVVVIILPGVLAYQAWTYHVLRRRLTGTVAAPFTQ